jgi:hypothetical protein
MSDDLTPDDLRQLFDRVRNAAYQPTIHTVPRHLLNDVLAFMAPRSTPPPSDDEPTP